MSGELQPLEELGRKMLEEIREGLGLPADAPGYLLWGVSPKELAAVAEEFAQEQLSPKQRRLVLRALPELERQGANLLAVVPLGEKVYIRGVRVQIVLPLRG